MPFSLLTPGLAAAVEVVAALTLAELGTVEDDVAEPDPEDDAVPLTAALAGEVDPVISAGVGTGSPTTDRATASEPKAMYVNESMNKFLLLCQIRGNVDVAVVGNERWYGLLIQGRIRRCQTVSYEASLRDDRVATCACVSIYISVG
jgi:hypothetical protein